MHFRHRPLLTAVLAGAATVGGFAPFGWFPLPILTLTLLVVLWRRAATARAAALLGFAFGFGCFMAGVSWVYVSMHDFGAMPAWLAAALTVLLCAYMALFTALAGWASRALAAHSAPAMLALVPALWTLAEWLRGWLFTGFPWLAIGYSQVPDSPLAGYAPVLGVYGVTLLTVASAALLAGALQRAANSSAPPRAGAVLALALLWGGGHALKGIEWTTAVGEPETQPIMMRMQTDLVDACLAILDGRAGEVELEFDARATVGVVLAAGGYPNDYAKGDAIDGLDAELPDTKVFHAGTRQAGDACVTNGGRVLCVVGLGDSVAAAQAAAYARVDRIHWRGMFCRRDIGYRAVARERGV